MRLYTISGSESTVCSRYLHDCVIVVICRRFVNSRLIVMTNASAKWATLVSKTGSVGWTKRHWTSLATICSFYEIIVRGVHMQSWIKVSLITSIVTPVAQSNSAFQPSVVGHVECQLRLRFAEGNVRLYHIHNYTMHCAIRLFDMPCDVFLKGRRATVNAKRIKLTAKQILSTVMHDTLIKPEISAALPKR